MAWRRQALIPDLLGRKPAGTGCCAPWDPQGNYWIYQWMYNWIHHPLTVSTRARASASAQPYVTTTSALEVTSSPLTNAT